MIVSTDTTDSNKHELHSTQAKGEVKSSLAAKTSSPSLNVNDTQWWCCTWSHDAYAINAGTLLSPILITYIHTYKSMQKPKHTHSKNTFQTLTIRT